MVTIGVILHGMIPDNSFGPENSLKVLSNPIIVQLPLAIQLLMDSLGALMEMVTELQTNMMNQMELSHLIMTQTVNLIQKMKQILNRMNHS